MGAGQSQVKNWVQKFDTAPLDQLFRGVIDLDNGNTATSRLLTLQRYSIENYLLDPFVIFGLLVENGTAPAIKDVSISAGDEHLIRNLPETLLQLILDTVRSNVESCLDDLEAKQKQSEKVEFTNGKTVQYPNWMLSYRGHDLLPVYQSLFGGAKVISPPRLKKVLQRVRLIPKDLALLMKKLQNADNN